MFIVKRSDSNPILSPHPAHYWEAEAAFNGCPVKDGSKMHLVYRALSERQLLEEPHINRSIIGRATSKDGISFDDRAPLIVPEHDFEKFGCEDPRVTKIGKNYFIFYTALGNFPFSANGIKVAVALSKDLKTVQEKHLVTPFNAKAMALFPEKIGGKYYAVLTYHTDLPDTNIALAGFNSLEEMWSPEYWDKWYKEKESHVLNFKRGNDEQTEVGAPPIKTKYGWLLVYSHATHYFSNSEHVFGVEAVLLDLKNPKKIIGRTKGPFLVPEHYYEEIGHVPKVVFPSGAMLRGKYLDVYYGAADTHTAKASVRLDDLINAMTTNKDMMERFSNNPLLSPRPEKKWEAHGTLNPAAIEINKKIHLLYRSMSDDDTSTFGLAVTKNGFTIDERSDEPVYLPRADFESRHQPGNSGCEDPRLVQIGDKIIMSYTAYDGKIPRVAVTSISQNDFYERRWQNWTMPILITPPEVVNKDGSIFPEKTKNGYVFLHRVNESICADIFKTLDFEKEKVTRCIEMIAPRRGMWDGKKVGMAGPPIKTPQGWLLLYHGISENNTYRVGAALLDLKDPTIVLSRTAAPIFEPKEDYEMKGVIGHVVFPCGMIKRKNKLFVYYGGADYVVGGGTINFEKLLKLLK